MTVSAETVQLVLERDGHRCVACGKPATGVRGRDWSIHHRRPRGMGGTKRPDTNQAANLLTLCGSGTTGCHGRIERRRSAAYVTGLLVWQYETPADIPVRYTGLSADFWALLDDAGGRYITDPPGAADAV